MTLAKRDGVLPLSVMTHMSYGRSRPSSSVVRSRRRAQLRTTITWRLPTSPRFGSLPRSKAWSGWPVRYITCGRLVTSYHVVDGSEPAVITATREPLGVGANLSRCAPRGPCSARGRAPRRQSASSTRSGVIRPFLLPFTEGSAGCGCLVENWWRSQPPCPPCGEAVGRLGPSRSQSRCRSCPGSPCKVCPSGVFGGRMTCYRRVVAQAKFALGAVQYMTRRRELLTPRFSSPVWFARISSGHDVVAPLEALPAHPAAARGCCSSTFLRQRDLAEPHVVRSPCGLLTTGGGPVEAWR